MSEQLRLLPPPKPLTERFGAAFFRGCDCEQTVRRRLPSHELLQDLEVGAILVITFD